MPLSVRYGAAPPHRGGWPASGAAHWRQIRGRRKQLAAGSRSRARWRARARRARGRRPAGKGIRAHAHPARARAYRRPSHGGRAVARLGPQYAYAQDSGAEARHRQALSLRGMAQVCRLRAESILQRTLTLLRIGTFGRSRDRLAGVARRDHDWNRRASDRGGSRRGGLWIARVVQHGLPLAFIEAGRVLIADLYRRRVETAAEPLEPFGTVAHAHVDHRMRHAALIEHPLRGVADHAAGKAVQRHRIPFLRLRSGKRQIAGFDAVGADPVGFWILGGE